MSCYYCGKCLNGNFITCSICQHSIHTLCSQLTPDTIAGLRNQWFCKDCVGQLLPFNHFIDDEEFLHELNQFYTSEKISFDKLQSLKINPFHLNKDDDDDIGNSNNINNNYDVTKINNECNYHCSDTFNNLIKDTDSDIGIIHFNSRSLNKNIDSITDYLETLNYKFPILAFSETWLKDNKTSHALTNIPGYNLVNDNRQGKKGGGVALYVSTKLNYNIRTNLKFPDSPDYESLFIEIETAPKKTIIGIVYRPPDSSFYPFLDHLSNCINKITKENRPSFICGDFNFDLLKLSNHQATNNFLNTFYSGSFYPLIDKPTRVTTKSSSLLDNIFTNVLDKQITPGVLYNDITDHFPVFQIIKTRSNPKRNNNKSNSFYTSRKINTKNISSLALDLNQTNWNDVLQSNSADESYNKFISLFSELYDKHLPITKKRINKRSESKPWITTGIIKSIKTRNKLYKTFLKCPNEDTKTKYIKYRNKLTHVIRSSTKKHYAEKFESCKNNIKNTWRSINDILGKAKKSTIPTYFTDGTSQITDPDQIAERFNKFFSDVGPTLAAKINTNTNFSDFLSAPFEKSIFFNPTSGKEILDIIGTFKNGKSPGNDNISPTVVKRIGPFISTPLSHIFNLALSSGVFPSGLKIAKVIPIFKKDDPHTFSNYRPISLLPCFSKILERLIYNRLVNFLSTYNILHENQYGFRKQHSTDLALLDIYDKISSALSNRLHTIGIFLDLSKAFDTIDHNILLTKLHHYGIRGTPLALLTDYLHNRKQFTSFNSHSSGLLPVPCGVPQGSILGPLLFLLYVNDIPNASRSLSFILFADDTNIFLSHHDLRALVQTFNTEITHVIDWFKANKLSLNVSKTNFIHFKTGNKTNKIKITIDNTDIKPVDSSKFLGVIIDQNLNWHKHITKITNQISRSLGIIKKFRSILPSNILFSLYNTLILPYISYCNVAWANTNHTLEENQCPWTSTKTTKIDNLFIIQKKTLRACTNSHFLSHTKNIFHDLNTLNIFDLNKLQTALFMYRYEEKTLPKSFAGFFAKNYEIHNYNTRSASNFRPIKPKLDINKYSIKYCGPKLWNSLNPDLKKSKSIKQFKCQYKNNLVSNYNKSDV